jgi:hypothetical protein
MNDVGPAKKYLNKTIDAGEYIGLSGGGLKDPASCRGASSGPHVHYAIHYSASFFPSTISRTKKTGRENTGNWKLEEYTENPLHFLRGWGMYSNFAQPGYLELYGVGLGSAKVGNSKLQVKMDDVSTGVLFGRSNYLGMEPTCENSDGKPCSRAVSINADTVFRNGTLQFFPESCEDATWHFIFQSSADPGKWFGWRWQHRGDKAMAIDLSSSPAWKGVIYSYMFWVIGCDGPGGDKAALRRVWFMA